MYCSSSSSDSDVVVIMDGSFDDVIIGVVIALSLRRQCVVIALASSIYHLVDIRERLSVRRHCCYDSFTLCSYKGL